MRRLLEGSIELPSGLVRLSLTADLAEQSLTYTLTRVDGPPVALTDLEPREQGAVELAVWRNLWKHVARTDPVVMDEIARIEAYAADARARGLIP
jgi:hypothetical protein